MEASVVRFAWFWHENERRAVYLRKLLLHLIRRHLEAPRTPSSPIGAWAYEKYHSALAETMDPLYDPPKDLNGLISYCLEDCDRRLQSMTFDDLAERIDREVLEEFECPLIERADDEGDHCRYLRELRPGPPLAQYAHGAWHW